MKYYIAALILISSLFLIHEECISQTNWTYYPEEPVLAMDPSVNWGAYGQPTVLIHNDTIKMWYAVGETTQTDTMERGRIHYAWSLDGYTWNKHPGNPVLDVGAAQEWDCEWVDTPGILWDGTEFKLYYYGDSAYFDGQDHTAIGLATSTDGISWTRQGKVLEMGAPDDWDGHHIELPALHYESELGLYAMLYTGMDRVNYPLAGYMRIGLATSWDGLEWTKWPENPVMDVGSYPSFNDIGVAGPALYKNDGIFEMWYTGVQAVDQQYDSYDSLKVGYAVSLNGNSWIQYPGNPVLQANTGDSTVFWAFDVVWDNAEQLYKMYFESEHWAYEEPNEPGVYNEINAIFCATAPRTVIYAPECSTSVSNDIEILAGESTQLMADGGDYYQWDPPEGLSSTDIADPIASPEETTTYTVLIVNDTCITKEEVSVNVACNQIPERKLDNLKVFPNPNRAPGTLYLSKHMDNVRICIYNGVGQLEYELMNFSGNQIPLPASLHSGIHMIHITGDSVPYQQKFIIDN